MLVKLLQKFRPTRRLVYNLGKAHGRDVANQITPLLKKENKIIDIGVGTGNVCYELQQRGYDIRPIDVANLSFVENWKPELYDGQRLPYPDKSFDVALVLFVLHHANDPETLIAEARRVANRLIIMEDIYNNRFEKYRTYALDSLLNLEFFGHPHSNRTDHAWRAYFEKQHLELESVNYSQSFRSTLKHVMYVLKV